MDCDQVVGGVEQRLVAALVQIRERMAKGPDMALDRESEVFHHWSESDLEIYMICDGALQAVGIAPFSDDRIERQAVAG